MIRAGIRRAFRLALRRRDRWQNEVEEEIKLHLLLRAEQLMAEGRGVDEAYAEAVRRFGPLGESKARLFEAARHREHRIQRTEYLSDLRQDVGFALRTLARQKGWAVVTVLTLALGIGATTAVFSVVSTFLLHPTPYPHGDRVVLVRQQPSQGNFTGMAVSIMPSNAVARAWTSARSIETLVGYRRHPAILTTTSEPTSVEAAAITPTFPAFAGQRPLIGRGFTHADIDDGGRVILLGEGFWRERLGGNPHVLGQRMTLDDSVYTVVGVMPAAFQLPGVGAAPIAVWFPLDINQKDGGMAVVARLRPGATIPAATRELDSLFARSGNFTGGKLPFTTVIVRPAEAVAFRDSLLLLAGAVALVLLIACVNVAHLLLARSATRQRELAVRAALGAGVARLLRQLLTESFLLTLTGTVGGLVVGWLALHALIALRPAGRDELRAAHLDPTTLGAAIVVAIVTGILFGIIGTVQATRQSTHETLKSGRPSASRQHHRVRAMLVVSEMALSAMLVVGASLAIRSVINLQRTNLGFDAANLYTAVLNPAAREFPTDAARAAFVTDLAQQLVHVPGVRSASLASVGPGWRQWSIGRLEVDGEPAPAKGTSAFIDVNVVQPSFFHTMGIALEQGATFSDTTTAAHQVVVNARFARRHWPDGSALGHRIRIAQADTEPWLTIVGVANDVATDGPATESSTAVLYTPFPHSGIGSEAIVLRTDGNPGVLARVTSLFRRMGARRLPTIQGAEDVIDRSISAPRFVMALLSIFTGLALLLASIGLYGVMAYTVAQQTREIGIRIALGATRNRVARSILMRGTALALVGALTGLIAAVWATKLFEHELHGVARSDPASFAAGAVVLLVTAVLACVVPTRRAVTVDPVTAIRAE